MVGEWVGNEWVMVSEWAGKVWEMVGEWVGNWMGNGWEMDGEWLLRSTTRIFGFLQLMISFYLNSLFKTINKS